MPILYDRLRVLKASAIGVRRYSRLHFKFSGVVKSRGCFSRVLAFSQLSRIEVYWKGT
jgi:hypothetical protein